MSDKQVLRAMYEKDKLNLSTGYFLWFLWLHYAHTKRRWMQVVFRISLFLFVGIIRWLLQWLEVRKNINRYNRELALKYWLDEYIET